VTVDVYAFLERSSTIGWSNRCFMRSTFNFCSRNSECIRGTVHANIS
jgi:hypothetical protein